jgi:hypothetical protein
MKINFLTLLISTLLLSVVFVGCKKKDEDYFITEYQNMMRENALLQAAFDDVLKVTENILMNNNDAKIEAAGAPLGCVTSIDTVVTSASSKTYTIIFPESCTSYDGKVRSGTIVAELNGTNYNVDGASLTIHLNNYYVNGNKFEGKVVSTNLGSGTFKIVVSNEAGTDFAKLSFSDGKTSYWKSTHKRTIYEGNSDAIIINNKYKISALDGVPTPFEGITSDSQPYTGTLLSDLVLDYSCTASGNLRYPIDGDLDLTMYSRTRSVNYGDGVCDFVVTMKAPAGVTKDFNLY